MAGCSKLNSMDTAPVAVKSDRGVELFSRRHKSFDHQYPHLVEVLRDLPDGAVVDGEVVALDHSTSRDRTTGLFFDRSFTPLPRLGKLFKSVRGAEMQVPVVSPLIWGLQAGAREPLAILAKGGRSTSTISQLQRAAPLVPKALRVPCTRATILRRDDVHSRTHPLKTEIVGPRGPRGWGRRYRVCWRANTPVHSEHRSSHNRGAES